MTIKDFEKIRKKYFSIYMIFMICGFVTIISAFILLVIFDLGLKGSQLGIASVIVIVLIIIFGVLATLIEKKYYKKYGVVFKKEYIEPIIDGIFEIDKSQEPTSLDLTGVKLIGKSHNYKIITTIPTKNYQICEISMSFHRRLRGYIIRKELKESDDSFIMTNYNYYFKPKIKEFKISSGIEKFDNKFLLYSNNPNYVMPEALANNFLKRLSYFKHIGVMVENNVIWYVLGVNSLHNDEVKLDISITDELSENLLKNTRELMQKLKSIAEFDLKK